MSTASDLSPISRSVPVSRILDAACRSVETALAALCRQRHDATVTVSRRDRDSLDQRVQLRLGCNDHITMDAQIRVRHVGGNVYDVQCSVEGGPSRQLTYSRPGSGDPSPSRTPELGRKLGTFLLNELERQIGRRRLRNR